jgi:aryl sulfotransferase
VVHFAALKADMPQEIRGICNAIIEHCSFDYMKKNATKSVPLGGAFWDGGAETFINKGTNGRWLDVLTTDDVDRYERRARAELGDECAHWLATGNT